MADDRQRTVAFNLAEPDPEFLYKLALPFAYVVPAGTTLARGRSATAPGNGALPDRGHVPGRARSDSSAIRDSASGRARPSPPASPTRSSSARLAMQPGARAWSPRARRTTRRRARGEPLTVAPVYRPRLHVRPLPATFYLIFNTTRPPFDDLRHGARSTTRSTGTRSSGSAGDADAARPTCQVLPPNFPGYTAYCPYTLDPERASRWTAPDRAKARRLVAASGTAGAEVALWWHRSFGEPTGRYLERLLDSLGYRARLRLFSGIAASTSRRSKRPERRGTSPAAPGSRTTPRPRTSSACSRCSSSVKLRSLLQQGNRQQDPAGAAGPAAAILRRRTRSWARLDRELTDQAPWVFLYNLYSGDFVSKRVGNYQHHPVWGTLFSQLWVQ